MSTRPRSVHLAEPTPVSADAPAVGPFPMVQLLEALVRWQAEPSVDRADAVRAVLEATLHAAGAHGAALSVSMPTLPSLRLGVGSLSPIPADAVLAGYPRFELGAHKGHEVLGLVHVDADPAAAEHLAWGLDFVVEAAWSRAVVHERAERLSALEAATRAVAAELDIDRVLGLIVDRVRELVGARFAALGIADGQGRIERFITSGISPDGRAAIGAAPRGHGLLGLIIRDGKTIRTDDIAAAPGSLRLPVRSPGDDLVPRRAGDGQGPVRRQPLPGRQARRQAVLGGGRAPGRDVRRPCRHRDRERTAPRPGPAAGGGRGAGAHRQGPARRDHPEHLRGRPCRSRTCPSWSRTRTDAPRRSPASTARSMP